MTLYANDFSKIFSKLLKKADASCYSISRYTNLDEGYLSRLRSGEKCNPSPETIVKIGLALAHLSKNIKLYDIEDLFNATGRSLS
jgi:hypothetical protein